MNGGLWGPALLLARHVGESTFSDIAAEMASRSLNPGAPLRTLLLLLANAPDAVHAVPPQTALPDASGSCTLLAELGRSIWRLLLLLDRLLIVWLDD